MNILFCLILSVRVTVYNSNFALIKDTRNFSFKSGRQQIEFKDVASFIDPTSVGFTSSGVEILEQNYRYDLVSTTKLFEKYVDHNVAIILKDGKLVEGKLLSFDDKNVTVQTKPGIIIQRVEEVLQTTLPDLPEGLITKPTLSWLVNAKSSGEKNCEVSYLTNNMNWHAEYIGILKENEMGFSGWVTVDNKSGATYKDAKLKLVAGEVHRATEERRTRAKGMEMYDAMEAPGARVEEREFFEYHIYELKDQTTIRDREEKQVLFVPHANVKTKTVYVYDGASKPKSVEVKLEFKNSEQEGLGIPLPKGKVRIYKEDKDNSLEFAGEDFISHTPKEEKVTLWIGNAFDIVGERKILRDNRITDRVSEQEIEISLRNHKKETVTIKVIEHLYGNWEILSKSHDWERKDANNIEFNPEVKPDSETKVAYKVRTSW